MVIIDSTIFQHQFSQDITLLHSCKLNLQNMIQQVPDKKLEDTEKLSSNMDQVIELLRQVAQFNVSQIQEFKEAISDIKLNRVLGSIFGSMIGDALGAYCQFLNVIPQKISNQVMNMPGGGTFITIKQGQYTDDNEMAYHLLQGLCRFDENIQLEDQKLRILKSIGLQYVRWVQSNPFDIGNTCGAAIYILRQLLKKESSEQEMKDIYMLIQEENGSRQSNGSLMRITPMAAFVSILELDPLQQKDFIIKQICLTHPNNQLRKAGLSWVYLLSKVINRKSDQPSQFLSIIQQMEQIEQFSSLKQWFQEAHRECSESMPAAYNMGWAKIAWSYGLKFLIYLGQNKIEIANEFLYQEWIKWVILRAGDTDTNAAISGGLIGAVIGFQRLPIKYLEKVFKLKYSKKENKSTSRDPEYEPSNFLRTVLQLIKKCKLYRKRHQHQQEKQEQKI